MGSCVSKCSRQALQQQQTISVNSNSAQLLNISKATEKENSTEEKGDLIYSNSIVSTSRTKDPGISCDDVNNRLENSEKQDLKEVASDISVTPSFFTDEITKELKELRSQIEKSHTIIQYLHSKRNESNKVNEFDDDDYEEDIKESIKGSIGFPLRRNFPSDYLPPFLCSNCCVLLSQHSRNHTLFSSSPYLPSHKKISGSCPALPHTMSTTIYSMQSQISEHDEKVHLRQSDAAKIELKPYVPREDEPTSPYVPRNRSSSFVKAIASNDNSPESDNGKKITDGLELNGSASASVEPNVSKNGNCKISVPAKKNGSKRVPPPFNIAAQHSREQNKYNKNPHVPGEGSSWKLRKQLSMDEGRNPKLSITVTEAGTSTDRHSKSLSFDSEMPSDVSCVPAVKERIARALGQQTMKACDEESEDHLIVTTPDSDVIPFPSLPDSYLDSLGFHRSSLADAQLLEEDDIEKKFSALSLAFKTDKLTLEKRIELQKRQRDTAEKNIDQELVSIKEGIGGLLVSSSEIQVREKLNTIQQHLEIIELSIQRLSGKAEVFGAVQQEERLNNVFDVLVNYVEKMKEENDKKNSDIEEMKSILQAHNLLPEKGADGLGEEIKVPQDSRFLTLGLPTKSVVKRRASVGGYFQTPEGTKNVWLSRVEIKNSIINSKYPPVFGAPQKPHVRFGLPPSSIKNRRSSLPWSPAIDYKPLLPLITVSNENNANAVNEKPLHAGSEQSPELCQNDEEKALVPYCQETQRLRKISDESVEDDLPSCESENVQPVEVDEKEENWWKKHFREVCRSACNVPLDLLQQGLHVPVHNTRLTISMLLLLGALFSFILTFLPSQATKTTHLVSIQEMWERILNVCTNFQHVGGPPF